ncbi:MAG: crossover junction endodeoxyribonuclease RuvC [Gammaproteobacteria bacterium]|nr:MAG: crossover junction endodeoxyribonuclease RuvC [Gammaproteobacteria bacterium]
MTAPRPAGNLPEPTRRRVRILGIDPGSRFTGFGVIDMQANHSTHISHGVIRVEGESLGERLGCIYARLEELIGEHRPDEGAIEQIFMHKNADSALKLGQARGTAVVAMARQGLPIFEYTANQVKQATVGRGHAAKQQVQHMVRVLLNLPEIPESDAGDALAVALCHGHSREGLLRMSGVSGIRGGRLQ